ncbi:MAG: TonB-dependent receptor [Bacteroidota bacterium]
MRRSNYFLLTILICLICFTSHTSAQQGIVKGFVYEKTTGEPVIFTSVYLAKTTLGATTDVNGYFAITQVPAGNYTLMVTFIGYDTLKMDISIAKGQILQQKLFLDKASIEIVGVNVNAENQEAKTETKTSVITVTPKKISQIPTIGGTADLAQYLQVMPGVIFTGDQGGQLYIRGGSPIQNMVLLDGMIIYNPFHSIGLFSVFDTDILRTADVYTGGFGAEYGGRISSVMDITTRDGNKKRFAGKVDLNTFGAKLLVEGPFSKQTDDSKGSASYIISAKNSYLKETSKYLYQYIDTAGLPFDYTDLYGKVSLNAANGSKVNLFGFRFDDRVRYRSVSDFKWVSYGGGANFVVIPAKSSMLVDGTIAYSSYKMTLTDATALPRSSAVNGFNLGLNFTYFSGKNTLIYGVELLGFKTDFNFYNTANRLITQAESTTEFAGFIKYKWVKGKFIFEPSFRAHEYASLSNFSPEPRLSLKFNATKWFRIKFAGGLYSQNLISASSDRDVVNLFYGFLSGPDNLQDKFDGKDVTHKLQKATHLILGFEFDLMKNLTMNLEGYYKKFNQLTNLNHNKIFDDNGDYSSKPDYLKKDFIIETGDAEGIDVSLKWDYHQFYLWAVYSYGFIHRFDGITSYVPHYDRRHNVNIVGAYTFGRNLDWDINLRWNLGSGFPFTKTQGFYELLDFSNGINSNYTTDNGSVGIIYAEQNQGRLPYYHRLDITLKKRFELGPNSTLEANIGVTNAYNRDNIFYFDRITYTRVDQLPIMPNAGVSLKF